MADKKQIISVTLGTMYAPPFTGSKPRLIEEELCLDGNTFTEAIDKIKELQEKYETSEYSNIRFDVYYDYSEDRDDHRKIYLKGDREETDEEFTYRIAMKEKAAIAQKERDERELLAIAARLGKTVV
jgi:Ran GTPase-activating protein (RanGAP) involved in mRNA processing and transport